MARNKQKKRGLAPPPVRKSGEPSIGTVDALDGCAYRHIKMGVDTSVDFLNTHVHRPPTHHLLQRGRWKMNRRT